jgi:hypothetical protein
MIGYKGFKKDLTCNNFQYEVGKTYRMNPHDIRLCSKGFHFCEYPNDVLTYYNGNDDVYAQIRATGIIMSSYDQSVTNEITILGLLTKAELQLAMSDYVLRKNGRHEWYRNGVLHRDDGPAILLRDGTKRWYQNGRLHRANGPAIEYPTGRKDWYQNDFLHRFDGPAIEYSQGGYEWWANGVRHRDDGPAIERVNGCKEWWKNGERHRDDGPAIERPSGFNEWWKNDRKQLLPKSYDRKESHITERNI